MSRTAESGRWLPAAALLLAVTGVPAFAQEQPVSLTGVFSTGYYTTENENSREGRISTTPAILNLDVNGFLGHPDFILYRVRPQLSAGAQATEAGFLSGNGINLSTTFLRRRSFPLTLTYSNVQREQLTYGSVNRVSGLRSTSHDRDFGLNWQWRAPHWPRLRFDLGRSRDTLEPDEPLIPEYESHSRHYTLALNDRRWGWTLDGKLRWHKFSSDFANTLEPDLITVALDRRTTQYQFSAQRPLWSQTQLVLSGGLLNSRHTFNDRPFDQDMRYVNGLLSFGWGERWKGNVRSGYTTNLLGTEVQEALGRLTGSGGSVTPGPEALVLVPFETRVSSLSFAGNLRYQAHRDWSLFGSLTQNNVSTPDGNVGAAEADYLNGTGGVSFNRNFSWATLTSQYSLNVGRLTFADIPDSRLLGHAFSLMAQRGSLERLELTASFTASFHKVEQTQPLRTSSQSAEWSLGRRLAGLVFRGGLGLQRSSFRDGGLDYDADGVSFRASAEHRRFQLRYSRNAVDGNTLQALAAEAASSSAASAVLIGAPLRTVLSSTRTQTLDLYATPWRRLETRLRWTDGIQKLDRRVNNDYEQLDLRVGYRFRLLTFAVGYTRYEQSFLTLASFMRSRFYFRVSRPFVAF